MTDEQIRELARKHGFNLSDPEWTETNAAIIAFGLACMEKQRKIDGDKVAFIATAMTLGSGGADILNVAAAAIRKGE